MAAMEQSAIVFSPLAMEHIPVIMHIEGEAYPEPWTYNMFRQELENAYSYFCVMFFDDGVAGYGGFWLLLDEAHVTRVTTVSGLRGMGLGRRLMEHLLATALARGASVARLEVRESNFAALHLYERLGFLREGRRKAYYQNTNEDAIVMVKKLG